MLIKLNKYKKCVDMLNKADPTMICGYYKPHSYSADELAEVLGCSKATVRTYITRMRKDGYDVRIGADNEYYIQQEQFFTPSFKTEVVIDKHVGHVLKNTRNGYQWSAIHFSTKDEIRQTIDVLQSHLSKVIEAEKNADQE